MAGQFKKIAQKAGAAKGQYRQNGEKRAAAMREAFEEAGLSGQVMKRPNVAVNGKGRPIEGRKAHVQYFPMRVDDEMSNWPEQRWRRRVWVSLNDIGNRRKYRHIRRIIDAMSMGEAKTWRKFLRLVRGKKPS